MGRRLTGLVVVLSLVAVACGGGDDGRSEMEALRQEVEDLREQVESAPATSADVSATSPSTTMATPVTVPPSTTNTTSTTTTTGPARDPQVELDMLAAATGASDYSRIAATACGQYSLINAPDRTRFLVWNGSDWDDISEALNPDVDAISDLVTTRDFTGDGNSDFLVFWEAKITGSPRSFGGVFSMHGNASCTWRWIPIWDGPDMEIPGAPDSSLSHRFIDGLYWDNNAQSLYATGYLGVGPRQTVRVRFAPAGTHFFTTHADAWLGDGG